MKKEVESLLKMIPKEDKEEAEKIALKMLTDRGDLVKEIDEKDSLIKEKEKEANANEKALDKETKLNELNKAKEARLRDILNIDEKSDLEASIKAFASVIKNGGEETELMIERRKKEIRDAVEPHMKEVKKLKDELTQEKKEKERIKVAAAFNAEKEDLFREFGAKDDPDARRYLSSDVSKGAELINGKIAFRDKDGGIMKNLDGSLITLRDRIEMAQKKEIERNSFLLFNDPTKTHKSGVAHLDNEQLEKMGSMDNYDNNDNDFGVEINNEHEMDHFQKIFTN